MGAREVVVDANHTVVLTSCGFVRGDQFAGAVPIGRSVRTRHQIKKRLYQGINRDGDTSAGSRVSAGGRTLSKLGGANAPQRRSLSTVRWRANRGSLRVCGCGFLKAP